MKILDRLFRFLMLFMLLIVLYDSFVHLTPLYYYLFFLAGLFFGKIFSVDMRVEQDEDNDTIHLLTGWIYIVLTISLLVFRYFAGQFVLESFQVVWATDAMYLFLIGIYRAKWKGILRQIDDLIYNRVSKPYRNR